MAKLLEIHEAKKQTEAKQATHTDQQNKTNIQSVWKFNLKVPQVGSENQTQKDK